MRPLSGMSHAVGSVRRTLRSRRQPSSEKPTSATRRRIPCRWSKRQSAPACARLASRMARSAGSSASSGATAAAAISRSCSRSNSPTEGGRAAGSAGPCGVAGRPGGRRGLRGKIAIARLCNACAAWTLAIPSPRRPRDGQKRTLAGTAVSRADAHFALFCNLCELMRLDGEHLSQIFQLRRLMAEVDRTLELNPNHVDAMAAKGTLLVRLPRLLGGDSARGEAMLREVLARDPNAFTTRLALANVCEARGDRHEALIFATRALQIAREQGRADKVAEAQAALAELRAAR